MHPFLTMLCLSSRMDAGVGGPKIPFAPAYYRIPMAIVCMLRLQTRYAGSVSMSMFYSYFLSVSMT